MMERHRTTAIDIPIDKGGNGRHHGVTKLNRKIRKQELEEAF